MEYIFAIVEAVIILILTTVWGFVEIKYKKNRKTEEGIKEGVQALLKDRITQSYDHYKRAGSCSVYAKENIQDMYIQYEKLGGNGVIRKMVSELYNLPSDSGDECKKE